jgi:DNA-binding GntR family transcriptional regulator
MIDNLRLISVPRLEQAQPPLGSDDVTALYRLRSVIETDLAARACLMHTSKELDRLEPLIEHFSSTKISWMDSFTLHRNFNLGLLRPAITNLDIRVLTPILDDLDSFLYHELKKLDVHPCEYMRSPEAAHERLGIVRDGNPDNVRTIMNRHHHRNSNSFQSLVAAADTQGTQGTQGGTTTRESGQPGQRAGTLLRFPHERRRPL